MRTNPCDAVSRYLPTVFQVWLFGLFVLHFLSVKIGALPVWSYGLLDVLVLVFVAMLVLCWRQWWPAVPRTWLCLLFIGPLIGVLGVLVNAVEPMTALAGLRRYFRLLPLALLPWLWQGATIPWRHQSGLLLFLLLLQVPLALHQRLAVPLMVAPGDHVVGTLGSPAFLTISMLCAMVVVLVWWLYGRLRTVFALGLMGLLFIPCTLNESKSVLVLLPLVVLLPVLLSIAQASKVRLCGAVLWLAVAMTAFFPIYDHFNYARWGYTLWDFLFTKQRVGGYLANDDQDLARRPGLGEIGSDGSVITEEDLLHRKAVAQARKAGLQGMKPPGKFDSIFWAVRYSRQMPWHGLFGVGAGNAVASEALAEGEWYAEVDHLKPDSTTLGMVLWELGWLGVAWLFAVGGYVTWQAWCLRARAGLHALAGVAGMTVLAVIAAGLLYKNLFNSPLIIGLFFYGSGLLVWLRRGMQGNDHG